LAGLNLIDSIPLILIAILLVLCIIILVLLQSRPKSSERSHRKDKSSGEQPSVPSGQSQSSSVDPESRRSSAAFLQGKASFEGDPRRDVTEEEDIIVAHSAPERKNGKPHS
jgi:hypothetical protein